MKEAAWPQATGGGPALAASNVSYAYGRGGCIAAISDVTLQVAAGEMVALLGPNGSGKSTLLRNLSGVLRPRKGHVQVFGVELDRLTPRERALRIGFVPQQVHIRFPFTVREVVMMGRSPHQGAMGIEGPDDVDIVTRSMELVRVTHLAGRTVEQLSGGEAQRVAIAQALAQESDILLLDEPTSHLDINFQAEIMDLLLHLNRTRGLTVLISLHDLNLASVYCQRVFLLRGGRLLAEGPPARVLTEERIRDTYGADVRVAPHPFSDAPMIVLVPAGLHDPT